MDEFKNSFYNVATQIAGLDGNRRQGQLALIDNFTMNAPMLKSIPFQKSSHPYHHAYGDVIDVQGMQIIDFDAPLPTMRVETQLKSVPLTPFGGSIEFGEDLMLQTHGTPKAYLSYQIPSLLRDSGARLERSLYVSNFLEMAIRYQTAKNVNPSASTGNMYGSMVAITWTPEEMTALHSPLPYGSGESFGQLFTPDWANGGQRHKLSGGVYGYAATIKMLIGILLANKQKISALVNIAEVPSANQLAGLVNAAQGGGSTRIYCSAAIKTSIAAKFAQSTQGNGLVSVSNAGEVSVLGVPIVTSHNIPKEVGFVDGCETVA
jgi:hypothetical protein